jgi:hypothetical protein
MVRRTARESGRDGRRELTKPTSKETTMRNIILAATAALILAAGAAPSLANGDSGTQSQCANILANSTGYSAAMVAYCRGK